MGASKTRPLELFLSPVDNQYVMELLKSLGIKDLREFLDSQKAYMFIRSFSQEKYSEVRTAPIQNMSLPDSARTTEVSI